MCHRVTVDHLQLAGIRFSLSVPGDSPRGSRCIGPDFIEPFVARSGHDFVQAPVRTTCPIGRVWMFLAFKASRQRLLSVCGDGCAKFRRLCVQQRARTDSETRFTSVFWMALHEALWALLIFDSQHHAKHNH